MLTIQPENSISDIKNRVLAAATSGLSKTARSTPLVSSNQHDHVIGSAPRSMDFSGILSPVSSGTVISRRQIWQAQNTEMVQFKKTSALALPTSAQDQVGHSNYD